MNKRLLIVALAAACSACALSATAFAQRVTSSQGSSQTTTTTPAQHVTKKRPDAQRAVPPLDGHDCIRDTGSHIPPPKGQCLPVAGRSYSHQDLMRTGATNLGQALQMLDPSVTVHGH